MGWRGGGGRPAVGRQAGQQQQQQWERRRRRRQRWRQKRWQWQWRQRQTRWQWQWRPRSQRLRRRHRKLRRWRRPLARAKPPSPRPSLAARCGGNLALGCPASSDAQVGLTELMPSPGGGCSVYLGGGRVAASGFKSGGAGRVEKSGGAGAAVADRVRPAGFPTNALTRRSPRCPRRPSPPRCLALPICLPNYVTINSLIQNRLHIKLPIKSFLLMRLFVYSDF